MWEDELFDEIQVGDKVWYETPQGQTFTAKAHMVGSVIEDKDSQW